MRATTTTSRRRARATGPETRGNVWGRLTKGEGMPKYIFVTGGVVSSLGEGAGGFEHRLPARSEGLERDLHQARPVHQRRPRHDVALPARRGLRHRRRRGDGLRPRTLRALHAREALALEQLDDRKDLSFSYREGAARRLPREDHPGHPAHHG